MFDRANKLKFREVKCCCEWSVFVQQYKLKLILCPSFFVFRWQFTLNDNYYYNKGQTLLGRPSVHSSICLSIVPSNNWLKSLRVVKSRSLKSTLLARPLSARGGTTKRLLQTLNNSEQMERKWLLKTSIGSYLLNTHYIHDDDNDDYGRSFGYDGGSDFTKLLK